MPSKPHLPPGTCITLPGHAVLAVDGRDAAAFLQAQTMNDVAALADGDWQWNGWLSPKGRLIALFALLRVDGERFRLVLPDTPAAELGDALRRFVFRSKVALAVDPRIVAGGPPAADAQGRRSGGDGDAVALDWSGDGGVRTAWLLPADDPALAAADPAHAAAWFAADLAHGLPRLGPGQREAWTPQMLSLERLAAFSVRKGCYPGQEIVARTHFLGQARRGLVGLAGRGLQAGAEVVADGRAAGTVTCVTEAGDAALAVLALDAAGALTVAGDAVERRPLLAGLARP